jgi:hypothetical protein
VPSERSTVRRSWRSCVWEKWAGSDFEEDKDVEVPRTLRDTLMDVGEDFRCEPRGRAGPGGDGVGGEVEQREAQGRDERLQEGGSPFRGWRVWRQEPLVLIEKGERKPDTIDPGSLTA